jgi:hypothetical protein
MLMVYKYPIPIEDNFFLLLPADAAILTVQVQGEQPCIWAMVNPEAELRERRFRLAGTGRPIGYGMSYIGTFQLYGGALVFHLFEDA